MLLPAGTVIVMAPDPAVVALEDSTSRLGSALVSVTARPPAGAGWPRMSWPTVSRFWPIATPSVIEKPGVLTVAVRVLAFAGVLNPAGTPAVSVVLPELTGWNCVAPLLDPPATVTGEAVIVPTAVFELVTGTLAEKPPRNGCVVTKLSDPFNTPANTVMFESAAPVVVKKFAPLTYASPDVATQPEGPRPYGASFNGPLPFIDAGDSRALSLSYTGGRLHLTFSTLVLDEASQRFAGGAYIVFSPTVRGNVLAANVLRQDYLIAQNNHLLFPSVAINAQGRGAIATTVVGPTRYPNAAYMPIDDLAPLSMIRIAAVGKSPEDGFTGYTNVPLPSAARWGDYSSAMIASDGTVWMAAEYIGDAPRTEVANWQTFIIQAIP